MTHSPKLPAHTFSSGCTAGAWLNTASKTITGQFDASEYSTQVVFLLNLAPGTPGLSQLIGQLAPWLAHDTVTKTFNSVTKLTDIFIGLK